MFLQDVSLVYNFALVLLLVILLDLFIIFFIDRFLFEVIITSSICFFLSTNPLLQFLLFSHNN